MTTRTLGLSVAIAACLVFAGQASAGDCCGAPDCCAACGGRRPCQKKVCEVVCGTETVKKYCWCVEHEEFCVPLPGCGPRRRTCVSCDAPNCDGSCDTCCESGGKRSWFSICLVPPKCGRVRCRKKLVKKEYECEVPVYECVVKYLCGDCSSGCCDAAQTEQESAEDLPPAPTADPQARRPVPLPPL